MVLFSVSAKIFIGQSADLILFWLFIVLVLVKILFAERIVQLLGSWLPITESKASQ